MLLTIIVLLKFVHSWQPKNTQNSTAAFTTFFVKTKHIYFKIISVLNVFLVVFLQNIKNPNVYTRIR